MLADRIGSSQLAEMSARGASLASGERPAEFPRLREVITRRPGVPDQPLEIVIGFRMGPESFPVVQVQVMGTVDLTCQRCLAPVSWALDLDVALTAVASDELASELADPFDSVVLDEEGGLALRAAVEDEILAALPLAPLHGDGVACRSAGPELPAADENPPRKSTTPFADLGRLMRQDGRNDRNK